MNLIRITIYPLVLSALLFYYFLDEQWNREMVGTWAQTVEFRNEIRPNDNDTVEYAINHSINLPNEPSQDINTKWSATATHIIIHSSNRRSSEQNIGFEKITALPPHHLSLMAVDTLNLDLKLHLYKLDMNLWGI